jgi:hypothetical protein
LITIKFDDANTQRFGSGVTRSIAPASAVVFVDEFLNERPDGCDGGGNGQAPSVR